MPPEAMTSRLLRTFLAWGLWMALVQSPAAQADLIVTQAGKEIPCRFLDENESVMRVLTGEMSGPRELVLAHAQIVARLQGAEEIAHIEAEGDAAKLSHWSAAYYHAGYETLARRTLRRALALNKKLGEHPLTVKTDPAVRRLSPAASYARFWNLVVARDRVASLREKDAAGLVAAAKWAHRAGLTNEAARYLRRARREDPTLAEVSSLARTWGVLLEGWIVVDLTPALEGPLFFDFIYDEGQLVSADEGMEFFCVPLRYEPDVYTDQEAKGSDVPALSRGSFKGRVARSFYGLRAPNSAEGCIRTGIENQEPIYERMVFKQGDGRRLMVELLNHFGPRAQDLVPRDKRPSGAHAGQPRTRTTSVTEPASGWASVILEIPKNQSEFKIEWMDGGEQVLDLAYIRQAGEVSPDRFRDRVPDAAVEKRMKNWPWSASPVVTKSLRLAGGSSPAMAALAIERLARIRRELEWRIGPEAREDLARWSSVVDAAILRAAARGEEQVLLAAWRYFCGDVTGRRASLPPHDERAEATPSSLAIEKLGAMEPDLQLAWLRIISCGASPSFRRFRLPDDCGFWWHPVDGTPSPRDDSGRDSGRATDDASLGGTAGCLRCGARMLEAILRSDDAFVCSEAIDVMLTLPPSMTDWQFLEHASAPAQRYALARVGEVSDRNSAIALLQALVLAARPELAQDVAQAAYALEMDAHNTDAVILSQWWSLASPERKPAFLSVLAGIRLGDSVYGKRFAAIMKEALSGQDELRDAAWYLAIAQLQYRRANVGAEDYTTYTTNPIDQRRRYGPFPLMIDPASQDPLIHGVTQAAREGSPELRIAALSALLESGYADEAAQCLLAPSTDVAVRDQLLKDLLASNRLRDRDAMLAFAGRLLQPKCAGLTGLLLKHLDERAAACPPDELWRLRAALKAGLHIEEMEALVALSPAPVAADLRRWLFTLCNMSPQDQQRLASARSASQRADRLSQINLRRGQIVDGRYGALAIVVTTTQTQVGLAGLEGPSPMTGRWVTPRRITVAMPEVYLTAGDTDESYEVSWPPPHGRDGQVEQGRVIGHGNILLQALPVRGPRAYFPVLRASPEWWAIAGYHAPGIDPEKRDEGASGPLRLPSRRVLNRPAPGMMTIDATDYLRAGLNEAGIFPDEDLNELIPDDFRVTLRYGAFGTFSGCGEERTPGLATGDMLGGPSDFDATKRQRLLNVMLVFERIGDGTGH